ncbi:MAG: SIR2 family protein [Anaerolineae bacterium]
MPNTLEERDWKLLLRRIKAGKCTPFLGSGACFGVLPLGSDIAQEWTREYRYPLEDSRDLARVAQFLAVEYDPMFPKEEILEGFFENVAQPDFTESDEPHGVLAALPLPVYMTTNYDDFMVQALQQQGKAPKQELCQWNQLLKDQPSIFDAGFTPTATEPVVFHLHGHKEVPESLVLTEDDYLDFLVNISRDQDLLPPRIQEALAGTSLLFIGYRLADWNFRVLFRGLVTSTESSLRRISVTVQLPPMPADAEGSTQQRVQSYLDDYFDKIDMRVYWGTAREFAAELRRQAMLEGIIIGT